MKKVDLDQEKAEKFEFDKNIKYQKKIEREFEFLHKYGPKEFSAQFVRAQAKEICSYLRRLKHTPFRSWESDIKSLVLAEDKNFLHQYFITENEFGEYIPDDDRIKQLVLTDPDPEEFPESRR